MFGDMDWQYLPFVFKLNIIQIILNVYFYKGAPQEKNKPPGVYSKFYVNHLSFLSIQYLKIEFECQLIISLNVRNDRLNFTY